MKAENTKKVLDQLPGTVPVYLDPENEHSGDVDIETDDFLIMVNIDARAYYSAYRPSTGPYSPPEYPELEGSDEEVTNVRVWTDTTGDDIEVDQVAVAQAIKDRIDYVDYSSWPSNRYPIKIRKRR